MHRFQKRRAVGLALAAAVACAVGIGCRKASDKVSDAVAQNRSPEAWIGQKVTGFTLPGSDGKAVDISSALGKRPVVLIFYRGVW